MKAAGMVYLVGAGPGRADLLTLRGAWCLARADAVVLDALVNRQILSHCRPSAEIIDAGKRGHRHVLMRQPQINALLARLARKEMNVVRLKGGDPVFFGRGGEEAAYLARQNIPFEIVPGVSSVTAVPAYAGVPITHRGHASMVTIVTGHGARENPYLLESKKDVFDRRSPGVDWTRVSPHGTLIILMGVRQLPEIVRELLAAGWKKDAKCLGVQWGTLSQQKSVEGELGTIVSRAKAAGLDAPAVIVVGAVVGLRGRLNWFENLPLFGRKVLVTRPLDSASALTPLLEAQGAQVLEAPAIRILRKPLDAAGRLVLKSIDSYDGLIITSANAARVFAEHWASRFSAGKKRNLRPAPLPPRAALYAIGPKTAMALSESGFPVSGIAPEFMAESLGEYLSGLAGRRFLIPRAEFARPVLEQMLRRAGKSADIWPLYRTVPQELPPAVKEDLLRGRVDAVTFTASSTVHFLMRQIPRASIKKIFKATLAASIGPITAKALLAWGVKPRVTAHPSTIESMAEAVTRHFRREKNGRP